MADLLVVGCGLIGTSVGLALAQAGDRDVLLHDQDPAAVAVAVARGAGRAWDGRLVADLVLVAVPPAATGAALDEAQRLGVGQTYTHVSSVQSLVQSEVEALSCDLSSIVGSHPLAGREISGAAAATADLFVGRPWALCPSPASSADAREQVRELITACGGVVVEVDAELHDVSVARLSHLPHVTASALAGILTAEDELASPVCHELSGPGLVDSTRLAAGDPALWAQILTGNAHHVGPAVAQLSRDLAALAEQLAVLGEAAQAGAARTHALQAVTDFLERGRQGRELVPVKRGRAQADFGTVGVTVDDRPGRLAALLAAAGDACINVEDVHVEHVPGRPHGLIHLLVHRQSVDDLSTALAAAGWVVQGALSLPSD